LLILQNFQLLRVFLDFFLTLHLEQMLREVTGGYAFKISLCLLEKSLQLPLTHTSPADAGLAKEKLGTT
jgi:hypothetical protein